MQYNINTRFNLNRMEIGEEINLEIIITSHIRTKLNRNDFKAYRLIYKDDEKRVVIGYIKIGEGDEYDAARKVANDVNRNIHKMNPKYTGLQIHEIHPVKFGGSPDNWNNKVVLTPSEHAKYTVFWNRTMKGL